MNNYSWEGSLKENHILSHSKALPVSFPPDLEQPTILLSIITIISTQKTKTTQVF